MEHLALVVLLDALTSKLLLVRRIWNVLQALCEPQQEVGWQVEQHQRGSPETLACAWKRQADLVMQAMPCLIDAREVGLQSPHRVNMADYRTLEEHFHW